MLLKPEWHAKSKITAIGALVVPKVKFTFGIINWRLEKKQQKQTRKLERY
jgi:hypothetical protein